MTKATENHTNNIVIGAGELYIDVLDADGDLTGERYVGDSIAATLAIGSETTTIYSGDGPTAVKLAEYSRSANRTLSMTLHDMSAENLALFVGGSAAASAAQSGTAVVDEPITVLQDRWYQLGQAEGKPQGVATGKTGGNDIVASITVSDAAGGGNAHTVKTDYKVDAANGRIYIVPNGGIADAGAETIYVDYTPTAAVAGAREEIRSGRTATIEAAVRYIEEAAQGKGRNLYARKCTVSASGDMALKSRDTEQQVQVQAAILEPSGTDAALYIDGEAA